VVAAVVVPRRGAVLTADEVIAHARKQLSSFKVPAVVRMLDEDELPMLPTGKVDRQALTGMLTR
jgi:acyl-CoA synthetase (AMP-forming)/AMP-acid ligase II